MKTNLEVTIKEAGLENPQANLIIEKFKPIFEEVEGLVKGYKDIVITNATQVEEIALAREKRLLLQKARTTADKVRKELKEDALKYSNVIQGIFNTLKDLTSPVEDYLEKQEKFVELLEAETKAKIKAERIAKLILYVEDISYYNFELMSDEVFEALLIQVKETFDKKKEAAEKIEKERLQQVENQKIEDEKMRIENAKLKKEAEEKSKLEEVENKKREAAQKKKDDEHQVEIDKERAAQKELADELKKKNEAESKRIQDRDKEIAESAENERQNGLAPERDKLLAYAELIKTLKSPKDLSKAGLEVVKIAELKLLEISQEIIKQIKNL